jgi:hypothetical protein
MTGRLGASVVAGLIAGVAFGLMMQMIMRQHPTAAACQCWRWSARSSTIGIGWMYHLFNSVVIGAVFGWLLGVRVHNYSTGFGWGAAYGFAWWILGGLILMPVFLGMPAFAPLTMPGMQMVVVGSLIGHLVYGLILDGAFVWLHYGVHRGAPLHA